MHANFIDFLLLKPLFIFLLILEAVEREQTKTNDT